jgi:hypothetical protein
MVQKTLTLLFIAATLPLFGYSTPVGHNGTSMLKNTPPNLAIANIYCSSHYQRNRAIYCTSHDASTPTRRCSHFQCNITIRSTSHKASASKVPIFKSTKRQRRNQTSRLVHLLLHIQTVQKRPLHHHQRRLPESHPARWRRLHTGR